MTEKYCNPLPSCLLNSSNLPYSLLHLKTWTSLLFFTSIIVELVSINIFNKRSGKNHKLCANTFNFYLFKPIYLIIKSYCFQSFSSRYILFLSLVSSPFAKFITWIFKFLCSSWKSKININPICYRGWGVGGGACEHILPAADSFVCFGNIRDLQKVTFSENSSYLSRFLG